MAPDGRGTLRQGGDEAPADVLEVEEEVRAGRLPPEDALHYPPWTGDRFVPLGEIAELAEAFDAPDARLAARLRRPGVPLASTALTASIALLGTALLFAQRDSSFDLVGPLALGAEQIAFDRAWWSPWTSQIAHGGSIHLFSNLAVVGYSGYRVERALGAGAWFVVVTASLLLGALTVLALSPLPVVGSSLLGYGLFGAHIAIGFRFGDSLPRRFRVRYGFGVLPFFALLFAGSVAAPAVSHSAHLGGLLGGSLAAMLVRPESTAPRADAFAAGVRNGRIGAALTLLAAGLVGLGMLQPGRLMGPSAEVELGDTGVTLELPRRLRGNRAVLRGAPAFRTGPSSDEAIFGALQVRWDEGPSDEEVAELWGRGGPADLVAAEPVVLGARAVGVEVEGAGGRRFRVVEQILVRGHTTLRLGWRVRARGDAARERLFSELLAEARVGEPPALAAARDGHRREGGALTALEYARQLHFVGRYEDADEVLAESFGDPEKRPPRAPAAERIRLWSHHPEIFAGAEDGWIDGLLEFWDQAEFQDRGIPLLVDLGRCARAEAALARWLPKEPLNATELAERVAACGAESAHP